MRTIFILSLLLLCLFGCRISRTQNFSAESEGIDKITFSKTFEEEQECRTENEKKISKLVDKLKKSNSTFLIVYYKEQFGPLEKFLIQSVGEKTYKLYMYTSLRLGLFSSKQLVDNKDVFAGDKLLNTISTIEEKADNFSDRTVFPYSPKKTMFVFEYFSNGITKSFNIPAKQLNESFQLYKLQNIYAIYDLLFQSIINNDLEIVNEIDN